jgi:CRP-like cAMP-binding protein
MPLTNHPLIKNRLLAAISQHDLDHFFSELYPVSLSLRQILYETGEPIEHVYFLEEGVASVLTTMASGATIEVGMIGSEGMAGLPALLGGEISAQHVVIQIPGNALRMSAALCKSAFDQNASTRAIFLRFTEAVLNLSAQTAACNRLHAIDQRCSRWLLMAFDRIQSDVMPMTQEFLSSMLGVRRAGVTEAAGELQRSGLIRYQHGRITLIDREGLEAAACECYQIDHERLLRLLQRPADRDTLSR